MRASDLRASVVGWVPGLVVRPIMSYGNRSSSLIAGWLAARVAQKTEEPIGDAGGRRDGVGSGSSCRGSADGDGASVPG